MRQLDYETFSAAFFDAIETILGNRLDDNERAMLYSFTMDALQQYRTSTVYDGNEVEQISLSPRIFMQVLGTEGGQSVRRTLWVDLAAARWRDMPGFVICSDVRFKHEFPVCDHAMLLVRNEVAPVAEHKSEKLAAYLTLRAKKPPVMCEAVAYYGDSEDQNKIVRVIQNIHTKTLLAMNLCQELRRMGVNHA